MATIGTNETVTVTSPHPDSVAALLSRVETRQDLDVFTVRRLQNIHLAMFGRRSGDSIHRRLALKIWKRLEERRCES